MADWTVPLERQAVFMRIGVQLASEMKKFLAPNRKLDSKHAKRLADSWLNGEFITSGETIKFNKLGYLFDGQHRIEAIILSGLELEHLVVFGLEPEAQDVTDIGKGRTVADHFVIGGQEEAIVLAAAARFILCLRNGPCFGFKSTPQSAEAIIAQLPYIHDAVHLAKQYKLKTLIGQGAAAGLLTLMAQKDQALAEQFWHQVGSGEGLVRDTPVFNLRQKLIENATSNKKVRTPVLYALVIKAWNHLRRGESQTRYLRWGHNEDFPDIQ